VRALPVRSMEAFSASLAPTLDDLESVVDQCPPPLPG